MQIQQLAPLASLHMWDQAWPNGVSQLNGRECYQPELNQTSRQTERQTIRGRQDVACPASPRS